MTNKTTLERVMRFLAVAQQEATAGKLDLGETMREAPPLLEVEAPTFVDLQALVDAVERSEGLLNNADFYDPSGQVQKVKTELAETQNALDQSRVELGTALETLTVTQEAMDLRKQANETQRLALDELNGYLDAIAAIPEVDKAEGGCDEAVRNAIQNLKDIIKSRENGCNAMETSMREAQVRVQELEAKLADGAALGFYRVQDSSQVVGSQPVQLLMDVAQAVKEACAQEAGASGHWVRERVDVQAIIVASQKK